jgi:uncharacterized protein (DUF1330 family)
VAGYVVAQILGVKDQAGFDEYRLKVAATIEQYGGKFLVRGGEVQTLEGDWRAPFVVIEFESAVRARQWYDSAEYRPLLELRQRCADTQLIIVEGV